MLKGNSKGKFDVIGQKKTGLENKHNTFTSAYIDLNNDSYPDIVNVNDTGQIEIYENQEGKGFKRHIPFKKYGSYMGLGVGDIDNDGDQDLYLSNIGNTIKVSNLTRGSLKKDEVLTHDHILLRNDGDFNFVDIGKKMGVNKAGFSWGALFTDYNLDSYLDLLVAQNFTELVTHKLAPLPSQRWNFDPIRKKFIKTDNFKNSNFGQAPLSVDVDGDGLKDVVWVNMKNPIKIYKGQNLENNNYINVRIPDNLEFANAKITVKAKEKTYTREYIIGGTGFGSDMSNMLQFGLGKEKKVDSISVQTIYGKTYQYTNPKLNSTVVIVKAKN